MGYLDQKLSAYWPHVLWCDMLMKPHALAFHIVHIHILGMYLKSPQACLSVMFDVYIKDHFK